MLNASPLYNLLISLYMIPVIYYGIPISSPRSPSKALIFNQMHAQSTIDSSDSTNKFRM